MYFIFSRAGHLLLEGAVLIPKSKEVLAGHCGIMAGTLLALYCSSDSERERIPQRVPPGIYKETGWGSTDRFRQTFSPFT